MTYEKNLSLNLSKSPIFNKLSCKVLRKGLLENEVSAHVRCKW